MLLLPSTIALAGEDPALGTWKLKSWIREVTATGEKIDQWVNVPMAILATPPTAACTQLLQRQSHQATRRQPDR